MSTFSLQLLVETIPMMAGAPLGGLILDRSGGRDSLPPFIGVWLMCGGALFLGCPASLGFAIGGVCCIACDKTPPPDARHHAGAPPPMAHAVVEMAPLGGAPSSGAVLGQPGAPYGSTNGPSPLEDVV